MNYTDLSMKMEKLMIGFVLSLLVALCGFKGYSQNTNLDNLLSDTQWNALFPKRAGTFGIHPQGYTFDFYSFNDLKQAADEMSDYLVQIRLKDGVWGQLITITKKSNGTTYIYSDVEEWWHADPTPETIINVDFEDFVNRTNDLNNKRELAAFLANISKETTGGWQLPVGGGSEGDYAQWGLYFVHEVGYDSTNGAGAYSQENAEFPPNPSVGYYGRGPIQLSWNYNYGQFSKFLYNDKFILLNNPDAIQYESVLAFKSAIWFWMMPQCPKPSCHQVMHDLWEAEAGEYSSDKMYKKGFAHTNNIINGGLECRSASTDVFTEKVVLRSELYKFYLNILGFSGSQISEEDLNDYSTLCYESSINAMQDYLSCNVNNTMNTKEIESQNTIIYSIPATEVLHVIHCCIIDKLEIVNSMGQILIDSEHNSSNIELNVSGLLPGFFVLKIYSDSNIYTKSVIIN